MYQFITAADKSLQLMRSVIICTILDAIGFARCFTDVAWLYVKMVVKGLTFVAEVKMLVQLLWSYRIPHGL